MSIWYTHQGLVAPTTGLLDYKEAVGAVGGALLLECGIEIRSYSLSSSCESSADELVSRSVPIAFAPVPFNPHVDLVAEDLRVTPAVLNAIDKAWANCKSVEYITADALCRRLVACMKRRIAGNQDR